MKSNEGRHEGLLYLLFAGPDQEDNENCQQNGSQSHNEKWKVGHQADNHQQLVDFCCRCVIYHHTLLEYNETAELYLTRD